MGNSNFKELSSKDSSLVDYQRVTLTVTPNGTLPEGMIISVTGSSPLGNWDLKKTRELQYSSGTYTLSFIIPTCIKGNLSWAFVLRSKEGSTICHERGPR
ncbi:hypothetical protein CYMTET_17087 [Cymbomonas tetramitiformis]|uniref:CBM20 domain-containing protein n=1 Tax=Cymbomonas tetramitiformis TaxID=36881 RepID=A0AAE0L7A8_9CHLO|nr:hypothetical protein CYMTET_17087 [Cymbomonas tetramitiformis]